MFATLDLKATSSPRNEAGSAVSVPAVRPKRNQVRRACDWCRMMRVKCDNDRPCYNCRQSHRECGMSRQNQFRSLTAAVREIEALRAQLRGLEDGRKTPGAPKSDTVPSPTVGVLSPGASLGEPTTEEQPRPPSSNMSTNLIANSSGNVSCTGPMLHGMASLPFFLAHMNDYIHTTRPKLDVDILACSSGCLSPPRLAIDSSSADFLSPDHELQALFLFWRSHYFSFPILGEGRFRKEYQALLAESAPGAPRKASPLVDIVLALSIQLASFVTRFPDGPSNASSSPSLAGFQYYSRCQEALDRMVESPSIVTVQCHIFSITYLYEAGFFNRAQVVVSKAVLTASLLGLSQEPQGAQSESEKELARRTWWALYALDAKLSMEMGRPPIIPAASSTCRLPSNTVEFAEWLAPHYQHDPACPPWLGFQTHTLSLLLAVGDIRCAFDAQYREAVGDREYDAFISNGAAREKCARCLGENMKKMEAWVKQVPKGYYVPRKEGRPFSTDPFVLDLTPNPNILIHCQRQRLLLELQYHQQCMSLYQAFLCFNPASDMSTPVADGNATTGLYHAMALTSMMHQALTTSEALSGVYHVFRWQKNALFTMIGYAYAFPLSHARSTIQKSVDMAIAVINIYRPVLSEAASVSAAAQIMANNLGNIMKSFHAGGSWSSTLSLSTPPPFSSFSSSLASASSATAAAPMPIAATQTPTNITSRDAFFTFNKALTAGDQVSAIQTETLTSPTLNSGENGLFDFVDMTALDMMGGQENNWDAMDVMWASMDATDDLGVDMWTSMGDIIGEGTT
ncbi:hypothetical protein S7711_05072 [Stachybotrys chartarum IBT 7711]|uniref:Zn(2)-C6 fungal-type domain-containing protein n=1 Tax=Stachybotrys chartarum (strain CBS 109288 / IBT 7711) TaxID=1280523 RepID=A0A084BAR4_STACB|nr:hypothetical protein S7711_05072 [Stachybotrys chartarum IBT 7711]